MKIKTDEVIKKSRIKRSNRISYSVGLKTGTDVIKAMDCAIYHADAIDFLLENCHEFTGIQRTKIENAQLFVRITALDHFGRDKVQGLITYLEGKQEQVLQAKKKAKLEK